MHYYVDGYNLLFRTLPSDHKLQERRHKLIEEFALKAAFLKLPITLVFDSGQAPRDSTIARRDFLDVVYTAAGETADEYIVNEIRESIMPKKETVVTSDKALAARVRRLGAITETVESFRGWLEQRYRNKRAIEGKRVPPPPTTPKKSPAVKPQPVLNPETPPEACVDYYLTTFEQRLTLLEKEKPIKPPRKGRGKRTARPKPPKAPKTPFESDDERWLKAFQRKLEDNN